MSGNVATPALIDRLIRLKGGDRADALAWAISAIARTLPPRRQDSRVQKILQWRGLSLGLEYLPGNLRHGRRLQVGYGHVRGHRSYRPGWDDGEALDCYVSPALIADPSRAYPLFEARQIVPETGEPDEIKLMLGFQSLEAARRAYLQAMPRRFLGEVRPVSSLKLKQGKTRQDAAPQISSRHPRPYQLLPQHLPPGAEFLDFGSGDRGIRTPHNRALAAAGYRPKAWPLEDNRHPRLHASHLGSNRAIAASGVLNVQSSEETLEKTIRTLKRALKPGGFAIADYLEPRALPHLTNAGIKRRLSRHFTVETLEERGGAPVFLLRR